MEKKNKLGVLHISSLDERDETITVWNMNLWWRRGNKFDGLTHAPRIIYRSHNVCMYAVLALLLESSDDQWVYLFVHYGEIYFNLVSCAAWLQWPQELYRYL